MDLAGSSSTRIDADARSSMRSWGSLTLQLFCMIVSRHYLTEAGCVEGFDPDFWENNPKITFDDFKMSIPLVHADRFQDVIWCTLKKAKETRAVWIFFWRECIEPNPVQWAPVGSCGEELKPVYFFDLLCLFAKAANITTQVCSHDVVVDLYSRFDKTSQSTTNQPSTTTKLTTATTKSTTAEKTTKNSPPAWSSLSVSSTASQDIPLNSSAFTGKQEVAYPFLGLSVLVNLLFVFFVARLCSQIRSLQQKLRDVDPSRENFNNGL